MAITRPTAILLKHHHCYGQLYFNFYFLSWLLFIIFLIPSLLLTINYFLSCFQPIIFVIPSLILTVSTPLTPQRTLFFHCPLSILPPLTRQSCPSSLIHSVSTPLTPQRPHTLDNHIPHTLTSLHSHGTHQEAAQSSHTQDSFALSACPIVPSSPPSGYPPLGSCTLFRSFKTPAGRRDRLQEAGGDL